MDRTAFNAFCKSLPATNHVVQWGNADVWKVGDKLFAVCGWGDDGQDAYTFKVTKLGFEVLRDQPGMRPAPYLAARGMSWIQQHDAPGLSDDALQAHVRASYDMAVSKLTKKRRAALGLG